MVKVFVSYNHKQGAWVWDRLVPVLKAGGTEVLIDIDRFKVGYAVIGQMDATQDQAEKHLLCLSADYLASDYCRHEMERAIALDPGFASGIVLPIRLDGAPIPSLIAAYNPLYADLSDDRRAKPWADMLLACDANLGVDVPTWLSARDEVLRWIEDGHSVNLLVGGDGIAWRALFKDFCTRIRKAVAAVELTDPETFTRPGFLSEVFKQLGSVQPLPKKPQDLVVFGRRIKEMPKPAVLALTHFDRVADLFPSDKDLFAALRWAVTEQRKIVLLVQSRSRFADLVPRDNALSLIPIKTVELA